MTWGRFLSRVVTRFAAWRRPRPPEPRGAITTLEPVNPIAVSIQPAHPDMALIMREWRAHQRHTPDLTWPKFLRILEDRERFFREEREEREAKLAQLKAVPRFTL